MAGAMLGGEVVAVIVQTRDGELCVTLSPGNERDALTLLETIDLRSLRLLVEEFAEAPGPARQA